MIDNLTEATRLLNATQLMLLGKNNQPISDLYYALQIAVDAIEELQERREAVKKLEESAEYYKDSLFGDGILFALKVIGEPKKKDWESEAENE